MVAKQVGVFAGSTQRVAALTWPTAPAASPKASKKAKTTYIIFFILHS
jgi:hypothetical protein